MVMTSNVKIVKPKLLGPDSRPVIQFGDEIIQAHNGIMTPFFAGTTDYASIDAAFSHRANLQTGSGSIRAVIEQTNFSKNKYNLEKGYFLLLTNKVFDVLGEDEGLELLSNMPAYGDLWANFKKEHANLYTPEYIDLRHQYVQSLLLLQKLRKDQNDYLAQYSVKAKKLNPTEGMKGLEEKVEELNTKLDVFEKRINDAKERIMPHKQPTEEEYARGAKDYYATIRSADGNVELIVNDVETNVELGPYAMPRAKVYLKSADNTFCEVGNAFNWKKFYPDVKRTVFVETLNGDATIKYNFKFQIHTDKKK